MSTTTPFSWPAGKRAALSISFDDARKSQLEVGIPILDESGIRATFYVLPAGVEQELDGWKKAHAAGHEMGNHTVIHPCCGDYEWSRHKALEDYTLDRMDAELADASGAIAKHFGTEPTTFAYPCGQSYVGRGEGQQSYVPLVARRFTIGRKFCSEQPNDPGECDLPEITALDFDGRTFENVREYIDRAVATGGWLVLAGHDVGTGPSQTVQQDVLRAVCQYAQDPVHGLWVDTVAAVGAHVKMSREAS